MFVLVGLVATACGRSGGSTTSGTTGGNTGQTTGTAAAAGDRLSQGTFGDVKNICGPNKTGAALTASDTGVTASTIQVSTVSDPGYSGQPGLNQEMFDAATAFSKWCNSLGGINGRQIKLKLRDAALFQFQQVVTAACSEKDFMMVGGGAVFDDTGQPQRLKCGLPTVAGYVVTPAASDADLTYQPIPNPVGTLSAGDLYWLTSKYPAAIKKVAVYTGAIATTRTVAQRYTEAIKALGWNVILNKEYNPAGEPTWRPFAEALKTSGVQALFWVGQPVMLADLMKSVSDIGYKLTFVRADANHYDPLLITTGGAAVNGIDVRSNLYPFLDPTDAAKNPATSDYREMMRKYDPHGKIAYLGVQGTSAWVLWAQAATACGADLTRDCVWANIGKVKDWTGGGLHSPQDVADNKPGDCFAVQQVQGTRFVLADISPNQGIYNCDPKYLFTVKGNYGTGAKCPNPKYATDPKPSNCGTP
jgi:ABC-type branched-subunit amino acid transport system substrate-binding protein